MASKKKLEEKKRRAATLKEKWEKMRAAQVANRLRGIPPPPKTTFKWRHIGTEA